MQRQSKKKKEVIVNKIIPFSSVDGPGNRTVIFLQGCNFDCLYCHNPETINICNNCGNCLAVCPKGALTINERDQVSWQEELCIACDKCLEACLRDSSPRVKIMGLEEIIRKVRKLKPFISGITVSGGEATLQTDFLTDLFREVKKLGLSNFLDTNGSVLLEDKPLLLENLDMAMIDFKSFKSAEHRRLTGLDNINVMKNVKFMAKVDKLYEVRTVIVPNLLDNYFNVDQISKLLAGLDSKIRYKLIKYRAMGVRKEKLESISPEQEYMLELVSIAEKNGCQNVVLV